MLVNNGFCCCDDAAFQNPLKLLKCVRLSVPIFGFISFLFRTGRAVDSVWKFLGSKGFIILNFEYGIRFLIVAILFMLSNFPWLGIASKGNFTALNLKAAANDKKVYCY